MSTPIPSQSSSTDIASNFFVNPEPDGSPLKIFTEAGGIHDRPKLVRTLKKNGAFTSSDPKAAQIILVDPNTIQGRHFIRDWGSDDNKVVLDYTWVKRSLAAKRPLLSEDDWGGCTTIDDGLPISGVNGEELTNALPTPRVTPEEPIKSQVDACQTQINASLIPNQVPDIPQPKHSLPSVGAGPSIHSGRPDVTQFGAAHLTNVLPNYLQPQYPNPMPPTIDHGLAQQIIASMFMQQQPGFQIDPQQVNSRSFSLALVDVMAKYGATWPAPQTQPQSSQMLPPMYSQPRIQSPVPEQALPFPKVPPNKRESLSSHKNGNYDSYVSPSPILPPSIRRRSVIEVSDSPSPVDDKRDFSSSKRRRTSGSSFKDVGSSQAPKNGSLTSNLGSKVFQSKSGKPLSFFVQIDLHNRLSIVDSIKKNGGILEKDLEKADCVVLVSTKKNVKVFTNLLRSAQQAGKHAVPPKFVHDCVEARNLLEFSSYTFDSVLGNKRKRKVSVAANGDDSDDGIKITKVVKGKSATHERRSTIKLEEDIDEKVLLAPQVETTTTKTWNIQTQGRPSPSPPPEHMREPRGTGYRFSAAENKFALLYGEILVERDYQISSSAIANAIHKKLPHHSIKSWRTQFARIAGSQLDEMRKRSGIAFRKLKNAPELLPKATTTSTTNSTEEYKRLVEDDIITAARFFADTEDDGTEPEEVLWARLTALKSCNTNLKWELFYHEHFEEVRALYFEFLSQKVN